MATVSREGRALTGDELLKEVRGLTADKLKKKKIIKERKRGHSLVTKFRDQKKGHSLVTN